MQPISRTRLFIVIFVAVFSLLATIPTVLYYVMLSDQPATTGPRPLSTTTMPPKSQKEAYAAWLKENPPVAQWLTQNQPYVTWEGKADALRNNSWFPAIPLGLDLIGGVDVTLVIDKDKAVRTEVSNFMETLNEEFKKSKIAAKFDPQNGGLAFTLKLVNKNDAHSAQNLINNYAHLLDHVPTEAELASDHPATLTYKPAVLNERISQSIEGARKSITERVDKLGVTQPRISIQGEDQIRVQVPGEKDPDRLINLVIKPANLEFRLVSDRNKDLIDADGKLKPGAQLPLGFEIRPGKFGKLDKTTHLMKYHEASVVVSKTVPLTGKDLSNALVSNNFSDIENPIQVDLEFKDEGRRIFGQLTKDNVGHQFAILLDDVVRTDPVIREPILDGRAMISGGFTNEEASDLVQILKAGSLPAPLKIENKQTVGASIGNDAIRSGVKALLLGSVIITLFMVVYYGTAGIIAVFALILNVLIILAVMALSHATLTLSGIGGILLTIGMAVDANVLIYERIREELASGKPLRQAIGLGFNRAFAVILDANVTTLLSALVLLQFTEGSVFGFALTMTFGLLANLFTGLTVTFTLCSLYFGWRGRLSLGKLRIFPNAKVKFIAMRWLSWGSSTALLVIAAVAVFSSGGLRYGVDFVGGVRSEVSFTKPVTAAVIRKTLSANGITDPNIQKVQGRNLFIIDINLLKMPGKSSADTIDATEAKVREVFDHSFPNNYHVEQQSSFGPQTAQQFGELAILVTLLASGAILVYLWFRFEMVFGVAAVVALLHDLAIVFFLSQLWRVQVNLEMVAALMVLMGFSVNDTIVIFDRIRENTRIMHGKTFGEICDLAMNQSLSRTILTSGTVFMAVLCLYLVGGEGLRGFAKVYLLGTICGTYSSDFIAAPMVYQWNKYKGGRLAAALALKRKKREAAKPIRSAGAAIRAAETKKD